MKNKTAKILNSVLVIAILFGNLSVFAQTKRVPANQQKCSGGWTGVVKYSRTQNMSENKTTPRVSGMGEDTSSKQIDYEYEANIIVSESPQKDGSTIAKASLDSIMTGTEITGSKEKISCDRGKTWKTATGNFRSESKIYGTQGGVEANVNVGLNADGTYNVSVALPPIPGKKEGSFISSFSGQCTAKEGKNEKMEPMATNVQGNSFISDGTHRFDPKNPNKISGSYTQKGPGNMVETITWTLRRCGSPLMITDVKLYEANFPSPNSWQTIPEDEYTIDGNMVRIVATIANFSSETKTTYLKHKELKENADLPESNIQVDIPANGEREVEYMWDTSGYAWKDGNPWNQSEIDRQIEVKIPDDTVTKNIQVRPKPVIVIPGMWSDPNSFSKFMSYFETSGGTNWKTDYAKVYVSKTAAENVPIVEAKIKEIQSQENAWHVDLVGHSTGGLIGRAYINNSMGKQFDGRPTVTNFVLVGTPNTGTPCATGVDTIFTRIFSKTADSFREISIKNMREFNKRIIARKGTKFHALVGNGFDKNCQTDGTGDGIVPSRSAIWILKDWKFSTVRTRHEEMLGEQANFMAITKWLAISPKGNHLPDLDSYLGSLGNDLGNEYFAQVSFQQNKNRGPMFDTEDLGQTIDDDDIEPAFATGVKLQPNKTTEVEIPVTDGKRMAINILAPPKISATLTDESGNVVDKNLLGTPESKGFFRTLRVNKNFQKGVWKLKLESLEEQEAEIVIVVFIF